MSAAAAEAAPDINSTAFRHWETELPALVLGVSRLEAETVARAKAAQLIGRIAAGASFEITHAVEPSNQSLMDATRKAREGDPVARSLVEINVRTDVVERTIKAGHIIRVEQQVSKDGEVMQHGQSAESIQENSLRFGSRHPLMIPRTHAEARNKYRLQELCRLGLLQDYWFVVFSRAADGMTDDELRQENFFVPTMSAAIQATSEEAGSIIITESAFVAGKRNPDAPRHDPETLAQLGDSLRVDYRGRTDAEAIDTPVLIHKSLMPNGVVDVVRWWDVAAGGTFFGQDKPEQDHVEYLRECQEREAELEPTVQAIVDQLVTESGTFVIETDATDRLAELSAEFMLRRAVTDEKVDGLAFGEEAAFYLEGARHAQEQGDIHRVEQLVQRAVAVETSNSCPGSGGSKTGDALSAGEKGDGGDEADCKFTSNECPLCHKKKVKTLVKKLPSGKKHISGDCGCIKIV